MQLQTETESPSAAVADVDEEEEEEDDAVVAVAIAIAEAAKRMLVNEPKVLELASAFWLKRVEVEAESTSRRLGLAPVTIPADRSFLLRPGDRRTAWDRPYLPPNDLVPSNAKQIVHPAPLRVRVFGFEQGVIGGLVSSIKIKPC